VAKNPSSEAIAFRNGRAVAVLPIAPSIPVPSLFQRAWPPIVLVFGLAITVAWTAFLGYESVSLIGSIF
jgi:hypothetical protein